MHIPPGLSFPVLLGLIFKHIYMQQPFLAQQQSPQQPSAGVAGSTTATTTTKRRLRAVEPLLATPAIVATGAQPVAQLSSPSIHPVRTICGPGGSFLPTIVETATTTSTNPAVRTATAMRPSTGGMKKRVPNILGTTTPAGNSAAVCGGTSTVSSRLETGQAMKKNSIGNTKKTTTILSTVDHKHHHHLLPFDGVVYALALGERLDIGLIEQFFQEKRGVVSGDAASALLQQQQRKAAVDPNRRYLEDLLSDGVVDCAVTMEKQVSYIKAFDELDCFAFSFGCIVCWNFTEEQLNKFCLKISPFIQNLNTEVKRDKVVYTAVTTRQTQQQQQQQQPTDQDAETTLTATPNTTTQESNSQATTLSSPPTQLLKPKIVYDNIMLTSSNSFEK